MEVKENVLLVKTFQFAKLIIRFHPRLIEIKQFEVASQLIRAGTSIGANSREAQRAESGKDFRHKLKIA
ncbi:MAG: four helix bundle protein, partial [Bacteroidetes bacterium]|nr:four helix bundle protein [Bacteroidota bacterium]